MVPRPVTPHVGVWIETSASLILHSLALVTPHVGVWIETVFLLASFNPFNGHTSCRCVD